MSYCTITDIFNAGFFKFDVTSNTNMIGKQPAPTVITNDIIPTVDAMIDDALRMYFVVPVDPNASPKATTTLNRIAKWYVAAEIASRLFLQQGLSESGQGLDWKTKADSAFKLCQTQGNYLVDAVPSADTPDVKSDLISDDLSQSMYSTDPRCGPSFRRDRWRF